MPELLKRRKLSQTELARRLGVSDAFISQVVSGKAYFSYINAAQAAWVLKCTMEDLHEMHKEK